MRSGSKRPRRAIAARSDFFWPSMQQLEPRALMATLDLGTLPIQGTSTTKGYGVSEAGITRAGQAGVTVTDVGDTNKDGYDDYAIATTNSVYLVFGSRSVNLTTIDDYLGLSSQSRNGDLGQLGSINQTNPVTGNPTNPTTAPTDGTGIDFDGILLTASQSPSGKLGASVAPLGDINGDGYADFAIGAPNAGVAGSGVVGGEVFIIYGSSTIDTPIKSIDLDTPTSYQGQSIRTLVDSDPGAQFGASVASAGNFLGGGTSAVAIGAPGAGLYTDGLAASGAVYVIPGNSTTLLPAETPSTGYQQVAGFLSLASGTAPFRGIGQSGGLGGVLVSGGVAGDGIGSSVASAGNFSGQTSGGLIDDLLIGAPNSVGGDGSAFILYGNTNFTPFFTNFSITGTTTAGVSTTQPIRSLNLLQITNQIAPNSIPNASGATASTPIGGAQFEFSTTVGAGARTGFAVSTAGDLDNDTRSDIMIGSPGFGADSGAVTLVYSTNPNNLNPQGVVLLDTATNIYSTELTGDAGSEAGYSLTATGQLNTTASASLNLAGDRGLVIGAPGYATNTTSDVNSGEVYVVEYAPGANNIPSAVTKTAPSGVPIPLNTISSQGYGLQITYFGEASSLGTSVGSSLIFNSSGHQVDGDKFADIIIGAPTFSRTNYAVSPNVVNAGAGFILEGGLLQTYFVPVVGIGGTKNGGNGASPPGPPPPPNGGGGSNGIAGTGSTLGFVGFDTAQGLVPPNGEALVPTVSALSKNKYYKPISLAAAYKAFRPVGGFAARNGLPVKTATIESQYVYKKSGINTLPRHVFDSSKYPKGTDTKGIKLKKGEV